MPSEYAYEMDGEFDRRADFDDSASMLFRFQTQTRQRCRKEVVQYQAAMQLAQQAPNLYDMGQLHRQMLEVLGIKDADQIIKLPDDIKPADPVTENMAILKQEPVKAFKYQDHEAHIQVHLAAAQDPKLQEIVGQSPFAGAIKASLSAHITEHVAFPVSQRDRKATWRGYA